MKNIHVSQTDRPSRLYTVESIGKLDWSEGYLHQVDGATNQNIYITSPNEDINENDYIITKDGKLVEVSYLLSKDLEGASKVVLTTDGVLIKDGVQTIDDEFLEWFVKNPSCEEIEVVKEDWEDKTHSYETIIPKEEPFKHECKVLSKKYIMENRSDAYDFIDFDNQKTGYLTKTCKKIENLKQEITLEDIFNDEKKQGVKELIDKHKQQRSYSEEEVLQMLENYHKKAFSYTKASNDSPREWFEQIKKK